MKSKNVALFDKKKGKFLSYSETYEGKTEYAYADDKSLAKTIHRRNMWRVITPYLKNNNLTTEDIEIVDI